MNYAQLLLPDFSLILLGALLCRYTALDRSVWQQVESLTYFFLFPVLLFHSIVKSPLDVSSAGPLIGAGVGMGLCGIALAYALPHVPLLGRQIEPRAFAANAQIAFRFNSFIGLALAERLAGPPAVLTIAVLIGFCVPMFNIAAVWPMARQSELGFARELARNPLIIGTLAGLACNLAGLHIPGWAEPTLARIGAASIALGLMAAGAGMRLSSLANIKALALSVLTIRHLLLPLIAALLARLLQLDALQTTVLLAFSALPTASSCYVLAARMGYDAGPVAALVTISTLAGMLSLPLALAWLR